MDLCALVGGNVRRYRKAARLSQEDVAHKAGLDRTYLSDIERGVANPSVNVLLGVAMVCGVHPALLLLDEREAVLVAQVLGPAGGGAPP
jgi:transcriptional regulator with XRE-family HTH domain